MGDSDWMSPTFAGKAEMFTNVDAKIDGHAVELGLSPAEVTLIKLLCAVYLNVYNYSLQFLATSHSVTEWRDDIFYGDKNKPAPPPPEVVAYVEVVGGTKGVIQSFRDIRDIMINRPGYTKAIGEDLMIVKVDQVKTPEQDVIPTITVHGAMSGYMFAIVVAGRHAADVWEVQVRQNGGAWKTVGSYTGKSADVTVTPTTPGQPEVVEVRVQLRKSNANYGQPSLIATVTVSP